MVKESKYISTLLSRRWKADGKPTCQLSPENFQAIKSLKCDIADGKLRLVENNCLCGNTQSYDDLLVSQKDRYGLAIPQVLCRKCGLIRSGVVFDDTSNLLFYQKYYRSIYDRGATNRFHEQQVQGSAFYQLLEKYIDLGEIKDVCEDGCGAGGILMPFVKAGKHCVGYDYDLAYLHIGKENGLNLIEGDVVSKALDSSFDLLILSHVMEHFLHPIEEMQKILEKVRMDKYLLIQVPGIYCIKSDYHYNPMLYFQNAHIYNFYKQYLRVFFSKLGLKVIYGDEQCTFILQKVKNIEGTTEIYDVSLFGEYKRIYKFLRNSNYYRFISQIKVRLYPFVCLLGWKKWRKYIC